MDEELEGFNQLVEGLVDVGLGGAGVELRPDRREDLGDVREIEVHRGAELYLSEECDAVLAVGGGSPIDAAKSVAIIVTNGGHIIDYAGIDRIPLPLPPMVMVPSTGGTGGPKMTSGMTNFWMLILSPRRPLDRVLR